MLKRLISQASLIGFAALLTACGGGDSSSGAGSTNAPGNVNPAAVGTYQTTTCVTATLARQSVKQQSFSQCTPTTTVIAANGALASGITGTTTTVFGTSCTFPQPPTFVNGVPISNNDSFLCSLQGESCLVDRSINGTVANQMVNIRVSGTIDCSVSGKANFTGTIKGGKARAKAPLDSPDNLNDTDLYLNLIEQLR